MDRSANPSGGPRAYSNTNGGLQNANGGRQNAAAVNPLSYRPATSLDWTPGEKQILKDLLANSELATESRVQRLAKIAYKMDKTSRDVAHRCNWLNKKEKGKRRKNDKKVNQQKVTDSLPKSSQLANQSNGPPNTQSMMSLDSDNGNPFDAIGGVAGRMLEQNQHVFEQISANFSSNKINDNLNLFRQARNNILWLSYECYNNDIPQMKAMPPLPVEMNDELAKLILDQPPMQFQQRRF